MNFCKRIISLILSFVICLSLYLVPASAAWQNTLGYYYVNSSFMPWAVGGLLAYGGSMLGAGLGTVVLPGGGTIEGTAIGNVVGTALSLKLYDLASYYAAGYTDEDALEEERGFVDGLDRTEASLSQSMIGFSCSEFASDIRKDPGAGFNNLGVAYPNQILSMVQSLDCNDKVLITELNKSYLFGVYFDSNG